VAPLKKLYAQIGKIKVELNFIKKCKEIGDTQNRMEAIKKAKSTVIPQSMRIAVNSTQFVVICTNT